MFGYYSLPVLLDEDVVFADRGDLIADIRQAWTTNGSVIRTRG
ncbi:MAG: hypothetical protein QM635_08700 [Microbacteriaceae bacterium]